MIGNIFVYFSFQDKKYIDRSTRRISLYCLIAINVMAVVVFAFLPNSIIKGDGKKTGPIKNIKIMWSLFKEKRVMWLCVYLIYAGNLIHSFCSLTILINNEKRIFLNTNNRSHLYLLSMTFVEELLSQVI